MLVRLERSSETSAVAPSVCSGTKFQLDLKLPKLNGEVGSWPEFWNLFCVSVHDNAAYAPVEKLVHLKAHLTGRTQLTELMEEAGMKIRKWMRSHTDVMESIPSEDSAAASSYD